MKEVLNINSLTKSYHKNDIAALSEFSISLDQGSICAVVGQSGSGKSTLLKIIAGLEKPDKGKIVIDGRTCCGEEKFIAAEKRKVGFVFQHFALFPHLSVTQNICFGLKKKDMDRVRSLLSLTDLKGYEDKYPHELSGGEQQRLALARAMAPSPSIILLDEPFSNLDPGLKLKLRNDLFSIIRKLGVTCIFVTHDINDAMAVGDHLIVLQRGGIVQQGTPHVVYSSPTNQYVANLFEDTNTFTQEDLALLGVNVSEDVIYGVRAQDFELTDLENNMDSNFRLIDQQYQGRNLISIAKLKNGTMLNFSTPSDQLVSDTSQSLSIKRGSLLKFS